MPRRQYLGGASPTRLNSNISNVASSFDINNVTKWPTGGANGPFNFTLDPGTISEEHCTATSRTGNTLNGVVRGADNTFVGSPGTGVAHTVGADGTVVHGWFAQDADDANAHIYDTTRDDHTQLMRADGVRHDVQARHQASTTIPVANPATLVVNQSVSQGASTSLARADHGHSVPRGTPVSTGLANAAGALGTFADAGHVHAIGAGSVTLAGIDPAAVSSLRPTGELTMWLTGVAPFGWVLLQGQNISRTGANAALFALWGTTYGVGDGVTTFGLPDARQRYPLGQAAAGTGSAGLGTLGGNIDHTHPLDTTSSGALIGLATVGNNIIMRRKAISPTYTSTHEVSNSLSVVGGSAGQGIAAQLQGSTDIANPAYIIVNFMAKL